ncbi:transmembrane 7 superfamily member 3 isoform X1 [Alligator mississippiensis]|uniref:Transmembrane 7 superfamily member 3 n=1 Tax=Alligator mississippiensis TaxID=8496 RepID=A0A151MP92_ALLMI|nr:transmembrane 7 superfamily member 3 isoform X1 [Alligator mississippiensis]KYO26344.1 transmembrane 7 superfamily member 3 [Alligator mississippiensis]
MGPGGAGVAVWGWPCGVMGLVRVLLLWALACRGGTLFVSGAGLLEMSLGKFRNVLLNETNPVEAVIRNIASNVTLIIFQAHAQQKDVTVSFDKFPSTNNSATGADRGLISILHPQQSVCTWYLQSLEANQVFSTAVSIPYTARDPIPGGCNLEFNLEVDPNIYLEYNLVDTRIKFAPANLGSTRGESPPSCDSGTGQNSRWRLHYDIYQYFLPENDLSEITLMSHLRKMSEVKSIKANGMKMITLTTNDKTDAYFSSLPGQGVIYNIIVWDPLWNTSAAYVPAHTYACSLATLVDNCLSPTKLPTKIFFTILAVLGLFICFFGHEFWKTDLFYMGFIFMGLFFFVLITRVTNLGYDVCLILTAVAGIVGGLLLVAYWWRFGFVPLCMVLVGLMLGLLFASMIFFTPLGDYRVFRDDAVFWVTFSCIALMIPVVFVGCPRFLNILACGIVGSYSVVLAIACYLYTSLAYITLDLLRRILKNDFSRAYTNVPFQTNDFIILAVWAMLALGGVTAQLRRERGEVPFPPHPYRIWKRERERRSTNILDPSHHIPPLRERIHNKLLQIRELFRKEQPAGERTPLLL